MSLKLFIWHLSRRFVRIENAGKGVAKEKSQAVIGWKGSMRERHLCTIFKLYTNSFCRQMAGLEVLIKVTAEPILLYLSVPSELWLRPWVWCNCWVSPEFLCDLSLLKEWGRMTGRRATLDSTVCSIERALFNVCISFIFLFLLKGMQWTR